MNFKIIKSTLFLLTMGLATSLSISDDARAFSATVDLSPTRLLSSVAEIVQQADRDAHNGTHTATLSLGQ